jgi:hypothetical protein
MNKFWEWMKEHNYGHLIDGKGKLINLSDYDDYYRSDLYCYPEKNHKQILIGYMLEYINQHEWFNKELNRWGEYSEKYFKIEEKLNKLIWCKNIFNVLEDVIKTIDGE